MALLKDFALFFCVAFVLMCACRISQAALNLQTEDIFRGIVLTSPALRVKSAHPIIGVIIFILRPYMDVHL